MDYVLDTLEERNLYYAFTIKQRVEMVKSIKELMMGGFSEAAVKVNLDKMIAELLPAS